MKRFLMSVIVLAGLGGCASYDYTAGSAPGGYYSGSPRYEYSYPGGYYGPYRGAYGYGYGLSGYGGYGYGGYGNWPGYYGPYHRPIYIVRPPYRSRGDHGGHDRDRDHDRGHGRPGGARPWHPGDVHSHPPRVGGGDGPRPNRPDRPRAPSGHRFPPRAAGSAAPSRPMPVRPVGQPPPAAAPAVPRKSHFRTRPLGNEP